VKNEKKSLTLLFISITLVLILSFFFFKLYITGKIITPQSIEVTKRIMFEKGIDFTDLYERGWTDEDFLNFGVACFAVRTPLQEDPETEAKLQELIEKGFGTDKMRIIFQQMVESRFHICEDEKRRIPKKYDGKPVVYEGNSVYIVRDFSKNLSMNGPAYQISVIPQSENLPSDIRIIFKNYPFSKINNKTSYLFHLSDESLEQCNYTILENSEKLVDKDMIIETENLRIRTLRVKSPYIIKVRELSLNCPSKQKDERVFILNTIFPKIDSWKEGNLSSTTLLREIENAMNSLENI